MAAKPSQVDEALERARRAERQGVTLHELARREQCVAHSNELFDADGVCPSCLGTRPVHKAACRLVR